MSETPPRLAVSALPSMLMTYFTGSPNNDQSSLQNDSESHLQHNHQEKQEAKSLQTSPSQSRPHLRSPLSDSPGSRHKHNRNSLPFMPGDADEGYASREGSLMSSNGKSRKRCSRPKTSYTINHAPPKGSARHKIHVRAKPLLQLHQLSASSRPMPAFELLPSAIFSPSLSRAINKAFRSRHGLCPADLAIVKAEKYHQHEDSAKEEDESRDVLALVCKGRKGDGNAPSRAKLFLDDGSEWEAYPLPNGGYEFFSTDEHGLGMTARWVYRRPRARRSQSASDMAASFANDQHAKKFSFSTISPNSRRHPIIASLTSTSLDINDSYTVPSPLAASPEISPPGSDHEQDAAGQESPETGSDPIQTSQSLKTLITATAVWVTLREGWCPGYRYDDLMMRSPSLKLNTSPLKSPTEVSSAAAPKDDVPRRSGSVARIFRSASGLKRSSTSSAPLDGALDEMPISRSASVRAATRRARAESTSTVIVHSKRPRGRRADTTSTTASGLGVVELANTNMTEEEESIETTAAMLAKSSKHSSAPTPLIPPLRSPNTSSDEEEEETHHQAHRTNSESKSTSTAAASPNPAHLRQKRESSTTSSNMSIEAKKSEAKMATKTKKSRRFRSLFCGMMG